MIDLLSIYADQWPSYDPQRHLYAIDAHCAHYAKWLLTAGAEPRFSLLLCSGDSALKLWKERMQTMGVNLKHTPTSIEIPLDEALLTHQGDHFNRTLFWMDGLDEYRDTDLLSLLNGRRNQLKKTATWVALVVQNPKTLDLLWEKAPQLCQMLQKRAWIWDINDLNDPSFKYTLNQPRLPKEAPLIDELFAIAKRPNLPMSYLNFSRLLRLGSPYAPTTADISWKELFDLWYHEDPQTLEHPSSSAGILAMIKHFDQLLPRDERKHLAHHLSNPLSWILGLSPKVPQDLDEYWRELGRCARGELELPLAEIKRLASLWQDLDLWLRGPSALWFAACYAYEHELELCIDILQKLTNDLEIPQEIRFEGHQKLAQIYTALHERQKASDQVDQLFELADQLHAPGYLAQAIYDRSLFLKVLDEKGSQKDDKDSKLLALTQGWQLNN
jgi:hypothetical protein